MKNNKGITLIALVITIVVLLILAAVSINAILGENGILSKARDADTKTTVGKEKEQVSMAYSNLKIGNKIDEIEITANGMKQELERNGNSIKSVTKEDNKMIIVFNDTNNSYTIDLSNNTLEEETQPATDNKLYLYKEGTEVATITGYSDTGGTNYSKNSDHIYLRLNDDNTGWSRSATIRFAGFDASGYHHLVIELEDMYNNSVNMSLFVAYEENLPIQKYDYWNDLYDGTGTKTIDIDLDDKNFDLSYFGVGWCCGSAPYFMAQNWSVSNGAMGEGYFKLKNVYLY